VIPAMVEENSRRPLRAKASDLRLPRFSDAQTFFSVQGQCLVRRKGRFSGSLSRASIQRGSTWSAPVGGGTYGRWVSGDVTSLTETLTALQSRTLHRRAHDHSGVVNGLLLAAVARDAQRLHRPIGSCP